MEVPCMEISRGLVQKSTDCPHLKLSRDKDHLKKRHVIMTQK